MEHNDVPTAEEEMLEERKEDVSGGKIKLHFRFFP
jgi:hypothetical protein